MSKAFLKLFDPNIDSPETFFVMDEVDGVQILRKYDLSSGEVRYAGTFEILYKTEDLQRFCLIMVRIANEWRVPEDLEEGSEEQGAWIVCQYWPGTHNRIFMKGLPDEAVHRITERYEKHLQRRKPVIKGRKRRLF